MGKAAQRSKPVVDGDDDDAVLAGEAKTVAGGSAAMAVARRPTVEPDKDGRIARIDWCPDIQRQAVLVHARDRLVEPGLAAGEVLQCRSGPMRSAGRTPVQFGAGRGERNRSAPSGAAA
jgi:hypothetical protein